MKKLLFPGLLLVAFGCATPKSTFPHAAMTPGAPAALPDVTLIQEGKRPFHLRDWLGHWVLVYFGYTNCPDVCPVALSYLADEFKRLKQPGQFKVLFVSVDPGRDDPARLAAFAHFHNPAFTGVTGAVTALDQLAAAFKVSYVLDKPAKPGGSYSVSHSNLVFLLDPQGREVATYVPGAAPGDLALDLNALTP